MRRTLVFLLVGLLLSCLAIGTVFARGEQEATTTETTTEKASTVAEPVKTGLVNYATLSDYQKETGKSIAKFNEAPMLAELVKAGKLPPVEDRISD